ncbi:MAG: ABC transporter permease [Thermoplasmata archaeon]
MGLLRYTARRLVASVPLLFLLSLLVFVLTRQIGDPVSLYVTPQTPPFLVEKIRAQYHLDEPIHVQYLYYLEGLFRGDWGYSRIAALPVTEAIATFLPATLELTIYAMILAVAGGVYLGSLSASRKDTSVDYAARIAALSGYSTPMFWLGIVLLLVFYGGLGIFPPGRLSLEVEQTYFPPAGNFRSYTGLLTIDSLLNANFVVFIDAVEHLVLPVFVLGYPNLAIISRIMRTSMVEVLEAEYIDLARSKGLSEKIVESHHARRNALISTTTMTGLVFAQLLGGAVLVEVVFSYPGMGMWVANASLALDHAAIMGFTLFVAMGFIIVNLVVDILYACLDPRIRLK